MPEAGDRQTVSGAPSGLPVTQAGPIVLEKRNFWLGVANGCLVLVGDRLVQASNVLPFLILGWTDQKWVVGLLNAVTAVGFTIPQVFMARALENRPRKMPFYWLGSGLRIVFMGAITAMLLWGPTDRPVLLLVAFFALYGLFMASAAISTLPFNDILAKSIPANRRGSYMMWRRSGSCILILLISSPIARHLLSAKSGYSFPRNFGMLFAIALVFMASAWFVFSLCREPVRPVQRRRITVAQHLRRGPRLWRRDAAFRGLLQVTALTTLSSMTLSFYAPFAKDALGASASVAGLFLFFDAGAALIGNIVWASLGDRRGNRIVLIGSGATGVAGAVLMLLACALPVTPVRVPGLGALPVPMLLVFATVVAGSFFAQAKMVGEQNYLLEIAPERRRPSYLGFNSAMQLPLALVPVLAGAVVDRFSYAPLFVLSALGGGLAVARALALREPRDVSGDQTAEAM